MEKLITLYKEATTDNIYTFLDIKRMYAELNNSDLPIDDNIIHLFIIENLIQNGGNIIMLNGGNDEVISWMNCYFSYMESDRYLNKEETEESAKEIYHSIINNDLVQIKTMQDNLHGNDGKYLLERLKMIME